jgi:hypothetical protein
LISCSHCGPEGGFSTSLESCGGTNCGSGTPRRDGPDLTSWKAERLTTRDMAGNQLERTVTSLTRLSGNRSHPTKASLEMTPRETTLTAALDANAALRVQAERLIAAYVAPESNRAAIVNELIALFDGPQQREAQRLAAVALEESGASGV